MKMNRSVFDYENYREFLKDSYLFLKQRDAKYSFRFFSKLAGFKSSSVLKMIMDGKRNMSTQSIDKFSQALKLNPDEASFFRILVLFNQAKSSDERQGYARAMIHFNGFKKSHPLMESQYNFYAFWYMPVIWELAGIAEFKEDPAWIAQALIPHITTSQAKKALIDLTQLGLLTRNEKGTLVKAMVSLRTPNEVASSAIAQWHREMIKRSAESIDLISRDRRDISSITCSMSLKTFQKLKEKIQLFRKELMDIAVQDPSPNMVYQVNFQLFPQAEVERPSDQMVSIQDIPRPKKNVA